MDTFYGPLSAQITKGLTVLKNMIKGLIIIDAGSNNKTVPKTICLAFRYDEAPVTP